MAQFNQLINSASALVIPPEGYVAMLYDENYTLRLFNHTGEIEGTSSIPTYTASYAHQANEFTTGSKKVQGAFDVYEDLTVSGSAYVSESLTISGQVTVSESMYISKSLSVSGTISADQYSGSGAQLYDISASAIVGLNLARISSGSVTASVSPNNGFVVNSATNGSTFTGSIKLINGSYSGSGAQLHSISASAIIGLNLALISSGSVTASVDGRNGFVVKSAISGSTFTGSIKLINGSYSGSGAQLYDISASAIVGLNLSRISTGSFTASIDQTGSLRTNAALYVTNSTTPTGYDSIASITTEGGLAVKNDAYFSSSVFIRGDLKILGTQSVQYITSSQLSIGVNIINLNTATIGSSPLRFGGLAVLDSGSTQVGNSGSFLWDSLNNIWISDVTLNATRSSAAFILGPENSGSLGSEVGITINSIPVGQGANRITSSLLTITKIISSSVSESWLNVPMNVFLGNGATSSIQITGSVGHRGIYVLTGSLAVSNSINLVGTQTVSGSLTLTGSLIVSASNISVQQRSGVSGSNIFGTASQAETSSYSIQTRGTVELASGTSFTVPTGVSSFKVTIVGAGGGGGASSTTNGNARGGGGGGLAIRYYTVVAGQSTATYAIGAGGVGGSVTPGTSGTGGGTTTFTYNGSTITATGGSGGTAGVGAGGSGGAASGGTINIPGGTSGDLNSSAFSTLGQKGGSSAYPLGGYGGSQAALTNNGAVYGDSALGYGGGGAGGVSWGNTFWANGGGGRQGAILIEW